MFLFLPLAQPFCFLLLLGLDFVRFEHPSLMQGIYYFLVGKDLTVASSFLSYY